MVQKIEVCFGTYIFTAYDCPDGREYCIANKVCSKARYSSRSTCKRTWKQVSSTHITHQGGIRKFSFDKKKQTKQTKTKLEQICNDAIELIAEETLTTADNSARPRGKIY